MMWLYIQFCSVSIPDPENVICLLVLLGWTIPVFFEIKQTHYYVSVSPQVTDGLQAIDS